MNEPIKPDEKKKPNSSKCFWFGVLLFIITCFLPGLLVGIPNLSDLTPALILLCFLPFFIALGSLAFKGYRMIFAGFIASIGVVLLISIVACGAIALFSARK